MEYTSLGSGGPKISRICLGTNNFGKQLDEGRARAVIAKAVDLGVNALDTADVYNEGRSEEIIGKAIEGDRNRFIVATKVGIVTDGGPRTVNLSAKYIERGAAESLKRLRTDHIDLFYLHRFDPVTPLEESLRALDQLSRSGKVRYAGVSNFTAEQLAKTLGVCENEGFTKPVAVQNQYSLLVREAGRDIFPFAAGNEISVFAYSPLWGGFLTGKYREGQRPPVGSRGEANRRYLERVEKEGDYRLLAQLQTIAQGAGMSLRELALAWILQNQSVTAPVVGASTPEQLAENCGAVSLRLGPKVASDLQTALG
jgi:1-deoxyxylulose-5-phosphate synthase